jgi:hypothetical protein
VQNGSAVVPWHYRAREGITAPPLRLSQPAYQHKCEKQKGAAKIGQNKNLEKTQNAILDNTQTQPKTRQKYKQFNVSATNSPKKDTKRDTGLRDLFRQLEHLVLLTYKYY